MGIVYVLLPLSLLLALASVVAFRWAAGDGQLDDLDSAGMRMLFDREATPGPAAPPSPSPSPSTSPAGEPRTPSGGRA